MTLAGTFAPVLRAVRTSPVTAMRADLHSAPAPLTGGPSWQYITFQLWN